MGSFGHRSSRNVGPYFAVEPVLACCRLDAQFFVGILMLVPDAWRSRQILALTGDIPLYVVGELPNHAVILLPGYSDLQHDQHFMVAALTALFPVFQIVYDL